jgi:hypothetical protein
MPRPLPTMPMSITTPMISTTIPAGSIPPDRVEKAFFAIAWRSWSSAG